MKGPTPSAPPASGHDKALQPHAHFDAPRDVVDDGDLSRAEKAAALDSLEQDARQMAAASAEGMGGGEVGDLHEVLAAKASLALSPTAFAYEAELGDLASRLAAEPPGPRHDALKVVLAGLGAVGTAEPASRGDEAVMPPS